MSRIALFIFIIISTFTIACGSSSDDSSSAEPWGGDLTDGGNPAIAGEYTMDREAHTVSCNVGGTIPETPAVLEVPVSITQDEDKFAFKYFLLAETSTDVTNWTQDCSIDSDGNFTCTEEFDYLGNQHYTLTIEGYFTTGGMVGAVTQTNTSGGASCTGEYGISLTGYPTVAGDYSMTKDAHPLSCSHTGDSQVPEVSGVTVAITQTGNKFTVKYFDHNPETDTNISNWTQDCTLDSESNFTCTEEYLFQGALNTVLTIDGSFTTDGMVGLMRQTINATGISCDTGEEGFGISFTN